jgi:hypothetical protein
VWGWPIGERGEGEKGGAGRRGTDGPEVEVGLVASTCASKNKEKGMEAGHCELLGRGLGGPRVQALGRKRRWAGGEGKWKKEGARLAGLG